MVVYWMMILWLKQMCQWWFIDIFWLKQSDTCVNGGLLNDDTLIKTKWYLCQCGLLNDDILIKTKWYLEIKTKWYLCQWWFIEWWLKQSDTDKCVNWFIEWWYFD